MGRVQSSKLQEEQSRMNKIFVFVCLEVLVGTALAALRVNPSCADDNPCPNGLAYMGIATELRVNNKKITYALCGGDVQDNTAYWTCTGRRGLFRRLHCPAGQGFDVVVHHCKTLGDDVVYAPASNIISLS